MPRTDPNTQLGTMSQAENYRYGLQKPRSRTLTSAPAWYGRGVGQAFAVLTPSWGTSLPLVQGEGSHSLRARGLKLNVHQAHGNRLHLGHRLAAHLIHSRHQTDLFASKPDGMRFIDSQVKARVSCCIVAVSPEVTPGCQPALRTVAQAKMTRRLPFETTLAPNRQNHGVCQDAWSRIQA